MSEHLFTYGTLQPDLAPDEIAHVVRRLEVIGKGTVRGTLFDLGSYPGAVIDRASPRRIAGTVFRLPEDSGIMRKLDKYEGYNPESPHTSLFIRRVHPVHMTNGQVLECWIYEYNGRPDHASIIESGTYTR
jgi:gamma-glutamylcyclotransferase (GGCT)/AIG2-like uncharacterized protein YtfP